MRNYSRMGGKPGKPGYRTPKSFLNKFMQVARSATSKDFYKNAKIKFEGYFKKNTKKADEKESE
jgi:hypothetical protein